LILPFPTVFWPYQYIGQIENVSEPGEITGRGLRRWDDGENRNDLAGLHYEGTPDDFMGLGVSP